MWAITTSERQHKLMFWSLEITTVKKIYTHTHTTAQIIDSRGQRQKKQTQGKKYDNGNQGICSLIWEQKKFLSKILPWKILILVQHK